MHNNADLLLVVDNTVCNTILPDVALFLVVDNTDGSMLFDGTTLWGRGTLEAQLPGIH